MTRLHHGTHDLARRGKLEARQFRDPAAHRDGNHERRIYDIDLRGYPFPGQGGQPCRGPVFRNDKGIMGAPFLFVTGAQRLYGPLTLPRLPGEFLPERRLFQPVLVKAIIVPGPWRFKHRDNVMVGGQGIRAQVQEAQGMFFLFLPGQRAAGGREQVPRDIMGGPHQGRGTPGAPAFSRVQNRVMQRRAV